MTIEPRLTTEERDAILDPYESLEIYNLTTHKKNFFNGTAWEETNSTPVGGGGGGWAIAAGKSPAINNSLTFSGTDGTEMTFPTTDAVLARTDDAGVPQVFNGAQSILGLATDATPDASALYVSQIWNSNINGPYPAVIRVNATNTLSRGGASLIELRFDNLTRFIVNKTGATSIFYVNGVIKLADPALGALGIEILAGAGMPIPFFKINNSANTGGGVYTIEVGRGSIDCLAIRNATVEIARFNAAGSFGIGALPVASAMFEIGGTGKGTLISRGTKAQRDAIVTPAQGLLYFVTDNGGYLSWYNGGWQKVSSVAD